MPRRALAIRDKELDRTLSARIVEHASGSRLLILSLPDSALRTHVESLGKPRDATIGGISSGSSEKVENIQLHLKSNLTKRLLTSISVDLRIYFSIYLPYLGLAASVNITFSGR